MSLRYLIFSFQHGHMLYEYINLSIENIFHASIPANSASIREKGHFLKMLILKPSKTRNIMALITHPDDMHIVLQFHTTLLIKHLLKLHYHILFDEFKSVLFGKIST